MVSVGDNDGVDFYVLDQDDIKWLVENCVGSYSIASAGQGGPNLCVLFEHVSDAMAFKLRIL